MKLTNVRRRNRSHFNGDDFNDIDSIRTGAVREIGDEVCISKSQRDVHVFFEAAAVFVAAPALMYIGATTPMEPWKRNSLYALAAASLAVDGGLLLSYLKNKEK